MTFRCGVAADPIYYNTLVYPATIEACGRAVNHFPMKGGEAFHDVREGVIAVGIGARRKIAEQWDMPQVIPKDASNAERREMRCRSWRTITFDRCGRTSTCL